MVTLPVGLVIIISNEFGLAQVFSNSITILFAFTEPAVKLGCSVYSSESTVLCQVPYSTYGLTAVLLSLLPDGESGKLVVLNSGKVVPFAGTGEVQYLYWSSGSAI